MTAGSQAPERSPLVERLYRRAVAEPEAPSLFTRVGWDWQWRSWARVADQVARGAATLRKMRDAAPGGAVRLAPGAWRAGPDAVTAVLAVLHAGLDLELADDPDARDAAPGDLPRIAVAGVQVPGDESGNASDEASGTALSVEHQLPTVRGPLDAQPLEPLAAAAGGRLLVGGHPIDMTAVRSSLAASLPASGVRSVARVDRPTRPILATGAVSLPWLVDCLAWALEADAAWALEPEADAFAASVAWVRPHVVVASRTALEALATRLEGRALRHARLRTAAVVESVGSESKAPTRDLAMLAERLAPSAPHTVVLPAAPGWFCRSAT
ncbi:MAG: hypothetical protein AAGC60_27565 [Acidobacteriota bacterium]